MTSRWNKEEKNSGMHQTYPKRASVFSVGGLGAIYLFLFNGVVFGKKSLPKGKAFASHTQKPFLRLFWQMKSNVYFGMVWKLISLILKYLGWYLASFKLSKDSLVWVYILRRRVLPVAVVDTLHLPSRSPLGGGNEPYTPLLCPAELLLTYPMRVPWQTSKQLLCQGEQ